jgi:hypothetical protein
MNAVMLPLLPELSDEGMMTRESLTTRKLLAEMKEPHDSAEMSQKLQHQIRVLGAQLKALYEYRAEGHLNVPSEFDDVGQAIDQCLDEATHLLIALMATGEMEDDV